MQISEQVLERIAQLAIVLRGRCIRFSLAATSSRKSTLADPQPHHFCPQAGPQYRRDRRRCPATSRMRVPVHRASSRQLRRSCRARCLSARPSTSAKSGTIRETDRRLRCRDRQGRPVPDCGRSTAFQLHPESNQTSRISISLRKAATHRRAALRRSRARRPAGRISSTSCVYQASAPSPQTARRCACSTPDRSAAYGTYYTKHRNRHAPDPLPRDAPVRPGRTIFQMRSLPHAGSHFTCSISSSAYCRNVVWRTTSGFIGVSILMNHCSVARKITG